jgi:hypothetical protein
MVQTQSVKGDIMRRRTNDRGVLILDKFNEDEVLEIKRCAQAFWSACEGRVLGQFRHPGLSKDLQKVLIVLRELTPDKQIRFSYKSLKPFLRWCITEGLHLQDERRDNARELWGALFVGHLPDFVQWSPSSTDYVEDLDSYLSWCASQPQSQVEA